MFDFSFSFLFLGVGLAIDILSCLLNSKKVIKHGGMSGIPIVSLVIYLLVFLWDKELIILAKFIDILFFVGVHVLLQYGIPVFLQKLLSTKEA
ncbi:hypothetical protein [Microbulbifer spongiae]|uniref:Uncharacterized protein n=1 Tax=Microbulbifer spongiae TaxID=2944933 RepID=A0ABY9EEF9_9GAMM|nr:hypothetical protein [Microbulbifer sp. MI-G]WKD51027.1 hypothetical protein M8T91_06295 [Microbulbifer sp. MI-G]